MDPWLASAVERLAREAGIPVESLALDAATTDTILDVARRAAHESGTRANAPLFCYLLGMCVAGGTPIEKLASTI